MPGKKAPKLIARQPARRAGGAKASKSAAAAKATAKVLRSRAALGAPRPIAALRAPGGSGRLKLGDSWVNDGAPSGVAYVQHRPHVEFLPSGHGEKRIRFRIPLSSVAYGASGSWDARDGLRLWGQASTGGSYSYRAISTICWSPLRMFALGNTGAVTYAAYNGLADSNFLALEGLSSSRFRVNSLEFEYEGTGSTQSTFAARAAWSQDCAHPVIGSQAYALGNYPEYDIINIGENVVTFAAWQSWRMKVPIDPGTTYYTYQQDFAGASVPSPTILRSAFPGCLTVCGNTLNTSALINLGQIYVSGDIVFSDMTPLSKENVIPNLMGALFADRPRLERGPELKSAAAPAAPPAAKGPIVEKDGVARVDPDDDDVEVVSPPKYVPPPSTYPGTPFAVEATRSRRLPQGAPGGTPPVPRP